MIENGQNLGGSGERLAEFELAQFNIAKLKVPLESPQLANYMAILDTVNDAADNSEGFVWRLQNEGGNAMSFRILNDPNILVNLSVWTSMEKLVEYTMRNPKHRVSLIHRNEWFEPMTEAHLAFWWIPGGHRPTVDEAQQRLIHLRENGSSDFAFDFADRERHQPPSLNF